MQAYLINAFHQMQENLAYMGLMSLIFLAASLCAGAIVLYILNRNVYGQRLSRFMHSPEAPATNKTPELYEEEKNGFTARIINPLYRVVAPKEGDIQQKYRLKLIRAGLRSRHAYRSYFAAKVLLALILPIIYLLISTLYTFTIQDVAISVMLLALGFFLPDLVLSHLTGKRQQGIARALPNALDLMVVCVESGLGLDMTMKRVGDEIRDLSKDLSDEFYLTNLETRAGKPREESFRNMSLRTGVPEIHNLMTVLSQTSRFGTNVATALRVHADAMRVKRRQTAEETAAKSAVKLVFPLIMFIFPTLMIVLAGPAALQIVRNLFPAIGGS